MARRVPWRDDYVIAGMYELRDVFRRVGLQMEVDHIIPLKNDVVSGLHVHDNLQLMPRCENMEKGNWWWPDMPIDPEDDHMLGTPLVLAAV